MSFLAPLFLLGALASAIPVVLHLLKHEPEPRVKFSAVKLLKLAPVEHAERRHLRELLLLALRVSALVLLALAFARPFLASNAAAASAGVTMVVLDTSYSLTAPGRFERAQALAKAAIARSPAGDLVGVVTFADDASTPARPSANRLLASSAVDHAVASFGATRYGAALAAAVQALDGRRGTIVMVTDLQESGWDAAVRALVPESARIEVADVGPLPENLAVTALDVREGRIVATVRNAGTVPRDSRVRLSVDDKPAGEAVLSVGPGQSVEVPVGAPGVRGAVAAVTIDDRDGIQADNTRYALLENTDRSSVLLVTTTSDPQHEAFYVQQALKAAAPADRTRAVAVAGAADLSTWSEDRLEPFAAILILSTRGLERHGRESLAAFARRGGGILIAAGPDVDGDVVGDVLGADAALTIVTTGNRSVERQTLAPADVRHPVFQPFRSNPATLGLVAFQQVARIAGTACQDVARFTSGAVAILDCPAGEGRGLVFASDLDAGWNDFPLHPTFVPFLHQAVRYLAAGRASRGEYLIGETPAGVPVRPGASLLAEAASGGTARRVVVNVDPREGDPSRISADEFVATVARLKEAGVAAARVDLVEQEERQHLWQYLLAFMLTILAVEGIVASRTA